MYVLINVKYQRDYFVVVNAPVGLCHFMGVGFAAQKELATGVLRCRICPPQGANSIC
jgi:hypothetical protein